jgi:hypothetical protein
MPERSAWCLVPGLGIRPAVDPGLVAPAPVAVERDGATLTVTHLFSGGGQTVLRAELVGPPDAPDADVPALAAATRIAVGGGAPQGWGMFSGGRGPGGEAQAAPRRYIAGWLGVRPARSSSRQVGRPVQAR